MDRKLSIEEFYDYRRQLENVIKNYESEAPNIPEEKILELQDQTVDEYVELEKELFSYDLRDIPFDAYSGMRLMDKKDEVLDLSKSHANIDFEVITVFGNINFKGCNIANLTAAAGMVSPQYLDDEIVRVNKDYFLSDEYSDDFKEKWYFNELKIEDIAMLPDKLVDDLAKRSDLPNHLTFWLGLNVLGLPMMVKLYRYSKSDYEDIIKLLNVSRNAVNKIDTTLTNPEEVIKNIYQVAREEILHPTYSYSPVILGVSSHTFPEKFIRANEDIFKINVKMSEELRTKYYERKLTSKDAFDNYEIFKDIPLSSFCGQDYLITQLNTHFGEFAFQKIYEAYPKALEYVCHNYFNPNFALVTNKDALLGFKEAVTLFLQSSSIIEIPEWTQEMFTKLVKKYNSLEELKTYDDNTCLLNYYQRTVLNKIGLDNLLKLNLETNILGENVYFGEFMEAFGSYLKSWAKDSISPETDYQETRRAFANYLNSMRKQSYFSDVPDYRFINGKFREDFRDVFISDDIPQDLINAFYKNKITPKYIRLHRDYIPYLERENLENVIDCDYKVLAPSPMPFIKYYTEKFGNKALLDLFSSYGEFVGKKGDYIFLNGPKDEKKYINESIRYSVYSAIIQGSGYDTYQFLSSNDVFVKEHPEIFLSEESLSFLDENRRKEIIAGFYAGKLSYNDIFLNPDIVDVLKTKNLNLAFRKNGYYAGAKTEPLTYLEKLGTEKFLKLCVTYGNYLKSTIGLLREENFASYEDLCQALEKIIVNRVKYDGERLTEEEAPKFLKEQYPELFLEEDAPQFLKNGFYGGLDFNILATNFKDWYPYLKGKDVLSSLIRSRTYPTEALREYFHNFGPEKALELGVKRSETVYEMLRANKVLLMKKWYDKTGQKFIPDYVVMQSYPETEIDKFLTSGFKWSNLMRIKEFSSSLEGKDAMLKIAYAFGTFDNDQSGYKKCYDLLTKLPTKINYDMGYILESLDEALDETSSHHGYYQNQESDLIYQHMQEEGLDFPLDKVFASLYRKSEDGSYVLTIDQQKYPKSSAIFREILGRFRELPIINVDLAHQLFGGFTFKYNPDFYKFFLNNLDVILNYNENSKYLAAIQKQFAEIQIINSNRHLTWDLAVKYVMENRYENVEISNEEMAKVASLAGYSQDDFEILQKIYDYGKQRVKSSIPRITNDTEKYHYEILRLDDPLGLAIGTLTDCCQEINNVAEVCMEHSMTSPDGRVFVIKDTLGNIVAQSWVWRNGNTLCFDNIEIPDKAFDRATTSREAFTEEVYAIYKKAAEELIQKDEEVYKKLLEEGSITEDDYQRMVLSKVTVGLGYNDIAASLKKNAILDRGNIARPRSYVPPVDLKRSLYTSDSMTQYILEGQETKERLSEVDNLPVHYDEYTVCDRTNFTKNELYHLEKLEILTRPYRPQMTSLEEYEMKDMLASLALHYDLNPKTIKVIYNTNMAIIYDDDDTTIHLGDILYNKDIGLNREKDITDVICLQVYLAILQIKGNKEIDTSRLDEEQLAIYNGIKDIKEMESRRGR